MSGNDRAKGQSGIREAVEKLTAEEAELEITYFEKEHEEEKRKKRLMHYYEIISATRHTTSPKSQSESGT